MKVFEHIDRDAKPKPVKSIDDLINETPGKKLPAKRKLKPKEIHVSPAVVKSSFRVGFNVGVMLTNFDGWKLTDTEATELSAAFQPVFDKWVGPNYEDYIIILNAVGALGTMVVKKVRLNKTHNEKKTPKPDKKKIEAMKFAGKDIGKVSIDLSGIPLEKQTDRGSDGPN